MASSSPWLTHLGLELPASATALPQQMAGVLSACSKLEELAMRSYRLGTSSDRSMQPFSNIVNVDALAACTQLLSLELPWCYLLTNLTPLGSLVNLQTLDMSYCRALSSLAPLSAMANLKELRMSVCRSVSDLSPLSAMAKLQSLTISHCRVPDLSPSQPW
jgi:Leucine-rich repeat (LRR) protein